MYLVPQGLDLFHGSQDVCLNKLQSEENKTQSEVKELKSQVNKLHSEGNNCSAIWQIFPKHTRIDVLGKTSERAVVVNKYFRTKKEYWETRHLYKLVQMKHPSVLVMYLALI
jgi:hypothetical protein